MGKEKKLELYVVGGKREWFPIRYVGLVDVPLLYKELRQYFGSHGYHVVMKEQAEATKASGKEETIEWEAIKTISPYVKYTITVNIAVARGVEVLVEDGGKREKKMNASVMVRFKAVMTKNYKPTFNKKITQEYARQVYEKYLTKGVLGKQEDQLGKETGALIDITRKVMGLLRA